MNTLYFEDMPLDWQLSMLNNSQNDENDIDISLLNQISNNNENTKEILDLKLTDNQLEHFLTTMDQPLINPYNHVNTTQSLNTLPTTTIANQSYIDPNALNQPHLIHNSTLPINPIKHEDEMSMNYQTNDNAILNELIHGKLNSLPGEHIDDINYTTLLYNQNLVNNDNNAYALHGIGTKRKDSIPDLHPSMDPNSNKKMRKVSLSNSVPIYEVSPSTVAPSSTTANLITNLPVNNYPDNLHHSPNANISHEQLLMHLLNKEAASTATTAADMNAVISSLIANSHQNMNSVLTTPEALNVNEVPATTTASASTLPNEIKNIYLSNLASSVKSETDPSTLHPFVTSQLVNNRITAPPSTQSQLINQDLPQNLTTTAATAPADSIALPIASTSVETIKPSSIHDEVTPHDKSSSTLRKVKLEDTDKSLPNSMPNSTSQNLNPSTSKGTASSNATNEASSSTSAKRNSVSWVKTQEKNEKKMAIARLNNEQTIPLQVIKHQKKVAHNAIERKYRNNINDRIKQLQDVIPALQYTKNIKEREKNQKENKNGGEEDVIKIDESLIIDGIPAARKLNKATVLKSATDYIVHLKKTSTNLKEENKRLYDFIKKMGGDEMLNKFTTENSDLYEEEEKATAEAAAPSSSTSSKTKEKGNKKKGKGKQAKSKLVQEASPPHIYSSDSPSPAHINSPPSISTTSNEEDATMLDVLSGERENTQNNLSNINSNSTVTTLMVSLLLFSVGLFEYGTYLDHTSDPINQYENIVSTQGKVLLGRSEQPLIKPISQPSFSQYILSKFAKMNKNIFIGLFFYSFILTIILIIGKRIITYNKECRNRTVSSVGHYSLWNRIILIHRIGVEFIGFLISKVNKSLFERLYRVKNYSYPKLILSQCRMIEKDILITKNDDRQSLLPVLYTTLQILNNIDFVTKEMSNSTCAYILYTTAIQFFMNFKSFPFGKTIALQIWRKSTYWVSKINEDKEEYQRHLRQSKKFDNYKKPKKINIANEAIDFILTYVNENPEACEQFFSKGHWISFMDRNTIEMSTSLYDYSTQKCLLITFSTAYKYDVLLNTFKEHGLKYFYMAPSVFNKADESTETETDSELENNSCGTEQPKDKKQIKEEIKNDYLSLSNFYYLSLSNYYLPNNYLLSSLEAPLAKIMNKLKNDKKSTKKKEKEQNKISKIDDILDTIVKVANSSLIVNDINLYWYAQILWIMVSWKKEHFKPIVSENNMDKINVQLFYADQFRKLIISSVTSYYADVIDDDPAAEEYPRTSNSDDLYSFSSSEEEEEEEAKDSGYGKRKGWQREKEEEDEEIEESESESEYVSEFKTETIPETSPATSSSSSSSLTKSSLSNTNSELGQAYQGIAKRYSVPNYSTVHFLSDSTRQFITLSLFTWLMIQKQKYSIAKRSIDKAHQILEKITNISLKEEGVSFTTLFEEENDYYPDIMLKFERIVVILAGTWLVESERMILNHERQKVFNNPTASSLEGPSSTAMVNPESTSMVVMGNNASESFSTPASEEVVSPANEVITLPSEPRAPWTTSAPTPITKEMLPTVKAPSTLVSTTASVVPKISEYVEKYVKLIHYYQEILPFIGSDTIAMECFKTIQHYQNDYKKYYSLEI